MSEMGKDELLKYLRPILKEIGEDWPEGAMEKLKNLNPDLFKKIKEQESKVDLLWKRLRNREIEEKEFKKELDIWKELLLKALISLKKA